MADSNVTKKKLAAALKDLTVDMPLAKISIGNICSRCDMSRKTFYYHFKDKEDLVTWIFNTEFVLRANEKSYDTIWEGLEELMRYFHRNHAFYRKALQENGPNSFSAYFSDLVHAVFVEKLQTILGISRVGDFSVNFLADGMVCMLKRWLAQPDGMTPEEVIGELRTGAAALSEHILRGLSDQEKQDE